VTHDDAQTVAARLLTLAEVAAVLRTPVATLRYWRHLGVGPDGFRLGRRVVYRRQEVDRWVAERQQAQSPRPWIDHQCGSPAADRRPDGCPVPAQVAACQSGAAVSIRRSRRSSQNRSHTSA
jgi:predicted DNA-binding transcriptional regulator AlpA